MAVLELHPANHVRHLVEGTECGWPIWYGEARVVTGDKGASHNQQERDAGREDGKPMQRAIVRRSDGFQKQTPWLGNPVLRDAGTTPFPR